MTEQLTGRELDAAVAERVMGFHWARLRKHDTVAYLSAQQVHYPAQDGDEKLVDTANPYSTDIAAAMRVVEKMWQCGFRFSLKLYGDEELKEWSAIFYNADTIQNQFLKLAQSPSEAICRAALAAVESK